MITYDEFVALYGPRDLEDISDDAKFQGDDGTWYIIPELVK